MRKQKVYNVVRNLDQSLEHEEISEAIYEIVNLLMRDESSDSHAAEEAPSIESAESVL